MYEFRNVMDHVEVYLHGVFQFSADNKREAEQELGSANGSEGID